MQRVKFAASIQSKIVVVTIIITANHFGQKTIIIIIQPPLTVLFRPSLHRQSEKRLRSLQRFDGRATQTCYSFSKDDDDDDDDGDDDGDDVTRRDGGVEYYSYFSRALETSSWVAAAAAAESRNQYSA